MQKLLISSIIVFFFNINPYFAVSSHAYEYQLYKNSDTPTRHMYHRAFFDAIVADQKKIVDLKWKVPFSALYQPNPQSVLQLSGEPRLLF